MLRKIAILLALSLPAFSLYKEQPFVELKHGAEGLIDYYKSLFVTDNQYSTIDLLKYIKDKPYRGHLRCPCGSGSRIRNCHGNKMIQMYPNKRSVLRDLDIIIKSEYPNSKRKEKLIFQ